MAYLNLRNHAHKLYINYAGPRYGFALFILAWLFKWEAVVQIQQKGKKGSVRMSLIWGSVQIVSLKVLGVLWLGPSYTLRCRE